MSFHSSSSDIHITHENGSTMLLCHVRDTHGKMNPRRIRLDDHIGNTDGTTPSPYTSLPKCPG